MSSHETVVVAGLGEVGRPLFRILSRTYECLGIDIEPVTLEPPCSVLHVCYPFQISNFVETTAAYARMCEPELIILNTTVAPGTTRMVQQRVDAPVVYSPVRGKHVRMEQDMLHYRKFVAGCDGAATEAAARHFAAAGFRVEKFRTPEIGELSKLVETTWLAMLVAWAQDIERMAAGYGASYDEINAFIKEIDFLPGHIFPGVIRGHCVLPNITILRRLFPSRFLDAVVESNQRKLEWECSRESEIELAGVR